MRQGRWRKGLEKLLLLGVAASMVLLCLRFVLTRHFTYFFLSWNLVLAMVPYVIALGAERVYMERSGKFSWLFGAVLLGWLFFFPNAPYIFTDYIHLERLTDVDDWAYDAAMISMFAFTGLLFGLYSLFLVHEILRERIGRWFGWAAVVLVSTLSGYGVYLGRFPRWNSWDVIHHPFQLAMDAVVRLSDPLQYNKLVLTTVLFASFILITYAFFRNGVKFLVRISTPADEETV